MKHHAALREDVTEKFIATLRNVIGAKPAVLHEPLFAGNEHRYVADCIDTTFVSSVGAYVNRFEEMVADYTGAGFAVAVVNGTEALHMALKLAGVERDDEVIVPALTFVATANAVTYCGAIPHFADSSYVTMGLDPDRLREHLGTIAEMRAGLCVNRSTGRVIRALVVMHAFGIPADLEGLQIVATDYNLVLLEDAAESLGSFRDNRHTGTSGLLGTLSFNGNKTITTGGGGMILTNDQDLAKHARHLTTTAKRPHRWEYMHDEIGYNYRLPNINAALGCAQMEMLNEILAAKRVLAKRYEDAFSSIEGVEFCSEPEGCRSNYWLNTARLSTPDLQLRDSILHRAESSGYSCRPAWRLMHRLPMYKDCPRAELEVAEQLESSLINLPSSAGLIIGRDA